MSIPVCKSPIDIITNTKNNDPDGIQFIYNEGDCTSSVGSNSGIPFIKLIYKSKNTISYKNNTYTLADIRLYKNSLHTINGKFSAGELVMVHRSGTLHLYICIPVSLTTDIKKSDFGNILSKLPSTINGFQSPKKFIPTSSYYSYSGTNLYDCKIPAEYIIFASSDVKITLAEFNGIANNSMKRANNTGVVIYSHNKQISANASKTPGYVKPKTVSGALGDGKHISFGDDKVYIDCQPIDAPDVSISREKARPPVKSINFSNLQDNKFVQMLLMFILFMIVMVIFFYSYEFTTGMFRELTKSVAKINPL